MRERLNVLVTTKASRFKLTPVFCDDAPRPAARVGRNACRIDIVCYSV